MLDVLGRNDDTIPSGSLEIATRPDGSPWVLGMGSYGTVSNIYLGSIVFQQPAIQVHRNSAGCTALDICFGRDPSPSSLGG